MRDRKFESSSLAERCQVLFDADFDPTFRAVLGGLIVLIIAFTAGLGTHYLM